MRKSKGPFPLGSTPSLDDLAAVAGGGRPVSFPSAARARVASARSALSRAALGAAPVYGVNTGFGELANRRIPPARLLALQRNLVLSHAAGIGDPLSAEASRGLLFLKANELARGYSGARPELVAAMAGLLNSGLAPEVPSRGSVGASGDLAPLAHMALVLLGEGRAWKGGRRVSGAEALRAARLAPVVLREKEGLALLNGTQAMQSVGGLALLSAFRVWRAAQLAGAMSLEAMTGTPVPFEEALHRLKPHPGQLDSAAGLRRLLAGSGIRRSHIEGDPRVQDPYSLRCMPQVHGTALDGLRSARRTVEIELGSVSDNPLVLGSRVVSGGNFHGQALSFAFDCASIALATLGNVSERRIFQLILGTSPRLNLYLAKDPGLESGWMIAQYAAAALASENKTLAHPASADSVPTSANKEDFVSMGMWAALKLSKLVENAAQIVAIELLCAAEGVEVHRPLAPGKGVARGLALLRAKVRATKGDEVLGPRMEETKELVLNGHFDEAHR